MEKMLERAVLFAYRRAAGLGADEIEALETALGVLFDARPDLEESDARRAVSAILADADVITQEPARRSA
jgi:hypothetical protein